MSLLTQAYISAASIIFSTSRSVRYSRVRYSLFGKRTGGEGSTVRFSLVPALRRGAFPCEPIFACKIIP